MVTGTSPGSPSRYSSYATSKGSGAAPASIPVATAPTPISPAVKPTTQNSSAGFQSAINAPAGTLTRTLASTGQVVPIAQQPGETLAQATTRAIEQRKAIENVNFQNLGSGQTPTSIIQSQALSAGLVPSTSGAGMSPAQVQALSAQRGRDEVERIRLLQQQKRARVERPSVIQAPTSDETSFLAGYGITGPTSISPVRLSGGILPTGVGLTGAKFTQAQKDIIAGKGYDQKTGQQLRAYTDAEKKALGKSILLGYTDESGKYVEGQNRAIARAGLGTLTSRQLALSQDITKSQAEVTKQKEVLDVNARIKELESKGYNLPTTFAQQKSVERQKGIRELAGLYEQRERLQPFLPTIAQFGKSFAEPGLKRLRPELFSPDQQQAQQQKARQAQQPSQPISPSLQVSQESEGVFKSLSKDAVANARIVAGSAIQEFGQNPARSVGMNIIQGATLAFGGELLSVLGAPILAKGLNLFGKVPGAKQASKLLSPIISVLDKTPPILKGAAKGVSEVVGVSGGLTVAQKLGGQGQGFRTRDVFEQNLLGVSALKAGELGVRSSIYGSRAAAPFVERAFLKPESKLEFGGEAIKITTLGKAGEPVQAQVVFPSMIKQRFTPTKLGEFFGVKPREEIITLSPKPVSKLGGLETGRIGEVTALKGEEGLGAGRAFITRQRFKIKPSGERVPVTDIKQSTIELQSRLRTGGTKGLTTVQILAGGRPISKVRARLKNVPTTYAEATGTVGKVISEDFLGRPSKVQVERFTIQELVGKNLPKPEETSIITKEQARFFRQRGKPFGLRAKGPKQVAVLKARVIRQAETPTRIVEEFAVTGEQISASRLKPRKVRGVLPTGTAGLLSPIVELKVPSAALEQLKLPETIQEGRGAQPSLAGPALLAEVLSRPRLEFPQSYGPTTTILPRSRSDVRAEQRLSPQFIQVPKSRLTPQVAQRSISKVEQQIIPSVTQRITPRINQQVSPRIQTQVLPQLQTQLTPNINVPVTPFQDVPPPPVPIFIPGLGGGGGGSSFADLGRVSKRKRAYAASLFGVVRGERVSKTPKSGLIKGKPFTGIESRPTVGRGRIPRTTAGFEKFKLPKNKNLPKFKI